MAAFSFFQSITKKMLCGRSGGLRRARDDANGPAKIFYERILQIH
jgi:hypothetical protein